MIDNNQRSNGIFGKYPLREIIAQYMMYHTTNGHSKETMRYYRCHLGMFADWADENQLTDFTEFNAPVLREYFAKYQAEHTRNGTQCQYRAVKALFRWAWDEYEFDVKNPISKIKITADPVTPIPGVDPDDVPKMFESAKASDYPERDCAMLAVLLDTGIRKSSFINIRIEDVDAVAGSIYIRHTKNHKPLIVYLGSQARKAVRRYLKTIPNIPSEQSFWVTLAKEPLSMDGMREVIRRICKRAGISEYGAHDFRRYFALQSYRNGADVYAVSQMLGHSGIEVTKRYLATDEHDRMLIHARTSPLDHHN